MHLCIFPKKGPSVHEVLKRKPEDTSGGGWLWKDVSTSLNGIRKMGRNKPHFTGKSQPGTAQGRVGVKNRDVQKPFLKGVTYHGLPFSPQPPPGLL